MYNLNLNKEYLEVPSHRSPTLILQEGTIPVHLEEVHSSPVTENISSERLSDTRRRTSFQLQHRINNRCLYLQFVQEGSQWEESLK